MIGLYADENVDGAIIDRLVRRGVSVLRAQDDLPEGTPDDEVLNRATALGRVLFSHDQDMLREGTSRQESGALSQV